MTTFPPNIELYLMTPDSLPQSFTPWVILARPSRVLVLTDTLHWGTEPSRQCWPWSLLFPCRVLGSRGLDTGGNSPSVAQLTRWPGRAPHCAAAV